MAHHSISRGLDLPLAGAPQQVVEVGPELAQVAALGVDFHGLRPRLRVQEGDPVRRGQVLFEDNRSPGVLHTSPAAGKVAAIHRGERRALQSVVIELDPGERAAQAMADDAAKELQVPFAAYSGQPVDRLDGAAVRALLVESGLWTAFRTRPFDRTPAIDATPGALFVPAIDTRPHAPAVDVALAGREADFSAGLSCIAKLTAGITFVCTAPGSKLPIAQLPQLRVETFSGPHPAGLPGTHVHLLHPVDLTRTVWHIGYQDVAAIGQLFATGRLDLTRVISLAGPSVVRPRLLRTRVGAPIDALTRGELAAGDQRRISGSVLDGRTAEGPLGFLGRHHHQVAVLPEGRQRELFGWIAPGREKFSVWRVVLGALRKDFPLALTTTTNGGPRAMVPIGSYERVMPLDLMPTFLLRALLIGDTQRAAALGCLELEEEDLALCTFVCPGKSEYGPLLRSVLDRIAKEGV